MHDRRSRQPEAAEEDYGPEEEQRLEGDLWAQDPVLSRAEHRRRLREQANARPARIRLRLGAVVAVVVLLVTWLLVSYISAGSSQPDDAPATTSLTSSSASAPREQESPPADGQTVDHHAGADGSDAEEPGVEGVVIVHVAGAVQEPGIVELEPGARVHEALDAAGGPQSGAALEGINLAAPAQDGTLIHVPTAEELASGQVPSPAEGSASGGGTGEDAALVDVNTADAEQLQTLPGIGPAMAERIISHRESAGPFTALEDLAAVSGIGPARLQELDGQVTW